MPQIPTICILCEKEMSPSGQTKNGKFNCSTCGKEWILEKREQKRYRSLREPEKAQLLSEFITIFDTNLKKEEMSQKLLAILKTRLGIQNSGVMVLDSLNDSFDYISYSPVSLHRKLKKLHPQNHDKSLPFYECLATRKSKLISLQEHAHKFFKIYRNITASNFQVLTPILYKDIPLGILVFDFTKQEEANEANKKSELISLIAEQFGIALYNASTYEKATSKYINYINLNSSCLLLNKLYMNDSAEIIKMTLLSISSFIETDQNTLIVNEKKESSITIHKLLRSIDSIDLLHEKIATENYQEYQLFFNKQEADVLATSSHKVIKELGYSGREILVLPSFTVQAKEYIFVLGRNSRKKFNEDEIELLSSYCNQVKITIENSFLTSQIANQERLKKEVQIAQDIQKNLLPQNMPNHPRYSFSGFMKPAGEIGGDYYDVFESPDKTDFVISIGDVSGKGVPAGMVMVTARTIIHSISRKNIASWDMLRSVNTYLYHNYRNSVILRFMSLILFRWKSNTDSFHYSGAGHGNIMVYRHAKQEIEVINTNGIVLGIQADIETHKNSGVIDMQIGDVLLMYTDGASEAMNRKGEHFGEEKLEQTFQQHSSDSPKNILNSVYLAIKDHIGDARQHDDVTLLCIKRNV
ncbi:MAG: GAF domain-containing SpoIIE family protein phosphatase [Spirochaetota bacterium]